MVAGSSASAADIVIVGGGCYGTFYARQLERARERGALTYDTVRIVDRDPGCRATHELAPDSSRELVVSEWGAFLDRWLGEPRAPGDAIVPSPLMPHLMYEWIVRRARARWPGRIVEQRPLGRPVGTPYDMQAPDGTSYLSFADWLCPTHCVEPAICPAIRAPRTWEMSDALQDVVIGLRRERPTEGPVAFICRHRAYGVGMFDAALVQAGDAEVARAGATGGEVDVLVATISACHGAASLLHLGAA